MLRRNRLAIIGRPNVGKSTLFNVITETRKAVVKDQPGVTRDVQIQSAEWRGTSFDVIDTGGVTDARDTFSPMIKEAVLEIVKTADALIVVMDGRSGICPEDQDLFRIAERSGKPFALAINKVDSPEKVDELLAEFYEFGHEPMFACAFEKRWGVDLLLEWAFEQFDLSLNETVARGVTMAIVGKPNAGKSSLCNFLLGENRMLVSEVAGTTVDAIDSHFVRNDREYTLIDTAGLRRKARVKEDIEAIAAFKSLDSLRRADIVLLVIDAVEGPSSQDAKIVEQIIENNKAVILVANKVDRARDEVDQHRKTFREKVAKEFHFFEDIPIVFVSALTGAGIKDLFETIDSVWDKVNMRITTSRLNNFFFDVIRLAPAPVAGVKDVKFYYLVQTKQKPPAFIAFANFPEGVDNGYRRFLAKRIKEEFGLEGIPVRIYAMKKGRRISSNEANEVYA